MIEPGLTDFCYDIGILVAAEVEPLDECTYGTAERFDSEVTIVGFHSILLNLAWRRLHLW